MGWTKARKTDFPAILSFLREREWACVALTARLKQSGFPSLFSIHHRGVIYLNRPNEEPGSIREILYHNAQGLIIPLFAPVDLSHASGRQDIERLFQRNAFYLYSLMGVAADVRSLEAVVERTPFRSIDYYLMVHDSPSAQPPREDGIVEGLRMRRAGIDDALELFPLQREYEKEEVLLEPERFSSESCMIQLRAMLKNEIVVVAELEGKAVAKAGTNAQGYDYSQIGGVFTDRAFRNRRIAEALLGYLLSILAQQGMKACLFVKKENAPAIALYNRLGFTAVDDFRISYYF